MAAWGRPLNIQCWRFPCWRNLPPSRQNTVRSRPDWLPTETYDDPAAVARLNKEQNELSPVVGTYPADLTARERRAQAEELLSDPQMKELAQEELLQAKVELEQLEEQLQLPVAIRMTTRMSLWRSGPVWVGRRRPCSPTPWYRMYSMYAERSCWKIEVDSLAKQNWAGSRRSPLQ